MLAITFLFTGILLIGWFLSGYKAERRLNARVAELFFIGIGERVLWVIDGDKLPWVLSVVPLPYPFKKIPIHLKWTEWVDGKHRKDEKVINLQKRAQEDKFKDVDDLDGEDSGFLGFRDEFVPSLRKFETAAYKIQVESKDGYDFYFIVTLVFIISDAMKVIRIPSFKMLANRQLENKLPAWAVEKTFLEIKKTDADIIKNPNGGIIVEDGNDLVTDFNHKFAHLGFSIDPDKVGIKIIEGKNAKNLFKLQQQGRELQQKTMNVGEESKLRDAKRKIEKSDADQENTIISDRIGAVHTAIEPIMDGIWKGKANVAAQHPLTLVEVTHEADETGEKLIEKVFEKIVPDIKDLKKKQQTKQEEEIVNE